MKTRNGFVSNSSSQSFILQLGNVSEEQIDQIMNHVEYANQTWPGKFWAEPWYLDRSEHAIVGSTSMNNFDMEEFMSRIGIPAYEVDFSAEEG